MLDFLRNDKLILTLILFNAFIVFILGFDDISHGLRFFLLSADVAITVLFVLEVFSWTSYIGFPRYWASSWNKFDFILILISVISLISIFSPFESYDLSFLLVLRVARVFKMFRFLRFIPNIEELIKGVKRALKASILVLIALVVYNFMLAVLSSYIFGVISPEYFGNPMKSIYSIFRIFTVEGWFDIPDSITSETGNVISSLVKLYFVFVLISGGILGISLVNSIFVDAMIADNNDELEAKVDNLTEKIEKLSSQINQLTIKQ